MTKARENSDYTGLQGDLALKSPVASPSFTGNVGIGTSSPTAILDVRRGDASGKIAEFHTSTGYGVEIGSSQAEAYIQAGSSQALKIGTNSTERMRIDSAGIVTMPYQPAFGAIASYTNIPLSGHVVMSLSERFDVGGNLTSNTFTAPVTGKYLITYHVYFTQVDASHNNLGINITTSNKVYEAWWQPNNLLGGDGIFSVSGSQVCDMDINDTMQYKLYTSGGTAQTDIHGDSTVSGCLIC